MLAWSFWLFLGCAVLLVTIKGGVVERLFSVVIIGSVVVTYLVNDNFGWVQAHSIVLVVDAVLLLTSLALVSQSQRYWPIWFAAFQSIAVATSVAFFIFPNHIPSLYINAQGFWFFPAMISITIGIMMDAGKAP